MTLYTVLKTLSQLCAPFVPFMSEAMYQNMVRSVDANAPESVHLCDFPVVDESFIDKELEAGMDRVLEIVTLGRAARNNASCKIRQPLSEMFVQGDALKEEETAIIREELNLKQVSFVQDASGFISYRTKPQLRTLGPRYGKLLGKISAYLAGDGVGDAIVAAHAKGEAYTFELDGTVVTLGPDDVLVSAQQKAGFVSETDHGLTVVLNTNLTPELIEEGNVREITSKLQTMRKEAGFEVADHIRIGYDPSTSLAALIEANKAQIMADTLADALEPELSGYTKAWSINGTEVSLSVEKRADFTGSLC